MVTNLPFRWITNRSSNHLKPEQKKGDPKAALLFAAPLTSSAPPFASYNEPGNVQPAHHGFEPSGFTAPIKSVASKKLVFAVDSAKVPLTSVQFTGAESTASDACDAKIASRAGAVTTIVALPTASAPASLSADTRPPPLPSFAQSWIQLLNTAHINRYNVPTCSEIGIH